MNLVNLLDQLPKAESADRPGTRSLGRLIKLMRLVATRPQFGWRLSDLAAASKLDRGTVHRMLACMVEAILQTLPADEACKFNL